MKKTLIALLVLAIATTLTTTCFGFPSAFDGRGTFRNGYAWGGHARKDRALLWAQGIEGLSVINGRLGTGRIFYVDSAVSGTSGETWDDAVSTLDAAVVLCTADRGDFILVAQGHAENFSAADAADLDVAGITVIGMGEGSLKPTFTYTNAAGELVIGAGNVTVENLRFVTSVTGVVSGIDIQAAGDNAVVRGCEFGYAESFGVDEFICAVSIDATANNVTVENCFFNAQAAGAADAVWIGAVSGAMIRNNIAIGDYSLAPIANVGAADEVFIMYNVWYNGTMKGDGEINTVVAMTMADSTSGLVLGNTFVSNVASASALNISVGDDMTFVNNYCTNSDGDEFDGVIRSTLSSVSGGGTLL